MSRFLKQFSFFLLFPVFIIFLSDTYIRQKNTLYKEKYYGALKNREKIEILILGNSHANYGIDPRPFKHFAYNIANVNQTLYYDKRLTLKLLDELTTLEYVLVSADYHTLYFSSQGIRNFWSFQAHNIKYKDEDFIFHQVSPTLFAYPPKVILSYLKRDFLKYFKFRGKGVDFPVETGVNRFDSISQGFIGYEGTDETSFSKGKYKSRANLFNSIVLKSEEFMEVKGDMENLIVELKERNITPILVTTPTYTEYNLYLDPEIVRIHEKVFSEISRQHDIPFWNFMNSSKFDKRDFYDMDHLNKRGAFRFGAMLNDSIKKLSP